MRPDRRPRHDLLLDVVLALALVLLAAVAAFAQGHHPARVDVVGQVKAAVVAAGVDLAHGPGECGRFEITKRVAWALKADGAGLVAKFGAQNGCSDHNTTDEPKYGVDVIVFPDGDLYDILNGTAPDGNGPDWRFAGGGAAALYRPAFDPGPLPGGPPPPPSGDLAALAARLAALETKTAALEATIRDQATRAGELAAQIGAVHDQATAIDQRLAAHLAEPPPPPPTDPGPPWAKNWKTYVAIASAILGGLAAGVAAH